MKKLLFLFIFINLTFACSKYLCPTCGSKCTMKNGNKITKAVYGIDLYACEDCGEVWTDKGVKASDDPVNFYKKIAEDYAKHLDNSYDKMNKTFNKFENLFKRGE